MARASLREALRSAVDGEHRYGRNEDARPELDKRWDTVIDLMMEVSGLHRVNFNELTDLCQKPTKT